MKPVLLLLLLNLSILAADFTAQGGNATHQFPSYGSITAPSWVTGFLGADGNLNYTVAANTDYHKRSGTIICNGNTLTVNQAGQSAAVSGASFSTDRIAIGGFISIFGVDLDQATVMIGGQAATVIFSSATQVNAILPDTLTPGPATVITESPTNKVSANIILKSVAPDIFSLNSQGSGPVAGTLQINTDTETYFPLDTYGITFGAGTHYLLLYGTGIRHQSANEDYALIGGTQYPIIYAGPQGQFIGLDQIAIPLPTALSGRGALNLQVVIDGLPSNTLTISFPAIS